MTARFQQQGVSRGSHRGLVTHLAVAIAFHSACAGVQVPQAGGHSNAEIEAELRAQASADMRCEIFYIDVEAAGPNRYTVHACMRRATYCCFERTFEVLCERAEPDTNRCRDPELADVPELDLFCDPTPDECGPLR